MSPPPIHDVATVSQIALYEVGTDVDEKGVARNGAFPL